MSAIKKRFLIYAGVFILAFLTHLIGLNQIGRTWDEEYKIDYGFKAVKNLSAGDFSLKVWDDGLDHPMVAKYIYGLATLPDIIPMPNGAANLSADDRNRVINGNYLPVSFFGEYYLFPYDLTTPRVVSALFNAAAVLLTVILAGYFLGNIWWSLLAGLLLLLIPRFVFLGQLVSFESLTVFLFCLIVLCFYKLLLRPKRLSLYILVGIVCGLFFWTRYNNIIFLPFLAGWLVIHVLYTKKKTILNWKLLIIPVIAFILGVLIWPLLWYDFPKYLLASLGFQGGRLVGISFYYWNYLLVTTPIPLLIGFVIGIFFSLKRRKYWHWVQLWWVLCVFIMYSIFSIPIGGTRLVAIIYPVIAILAAYGYAMLLKNKFVYVLVPIVVFMLFEQVKVFPYYLDYYNQFVGSTSDAIQKGYDFSWWGEGQREAGLWLLDNVPKGSSVGLIVTPQHVFPSTKADLVFKGEVNEKSNADYIVVSRQDARGLSKKFFNTHKIVYQAVVDNEPLVSVMKKKVNH